MTGRLSLLPLGGHAQGHSLYRLSDDAVLTRDYPADCRIERICKDIYPHSTMQVRKRGPNSLLLSLPDNMDEVMRAMFVQRMESCHVHT